MTKEEIDAAVLATIPKRQNHTGTTLWRDLNEPVWLVLDSLTRLRARGVIYLDAHQCWRLTDDQ